jgi:hypothetical protein
MTDKLPHMAVVMHVLIIKIEEDDDRAVFVYGLDEDNLGRVTLDKLAGTPVNSIPVEHPRAERIFGAAAYKIMQAFESGDALPERMQYVSG